MAWAVASLEPSSTTTTLTRCRRGEVSRILRRSRLASTRYCSLYAGTITDRLVVVCCLCSSTRYAEIPVAGRNQRLLSARLRGKLASPRVLCSVILRPILLEYYTRNQWWVKSADRISQLPKGHKTQFNIFSQMQPGPLRIGLSRG